MCLKHFWHEVCPVAPTFSIALVSLFRSNGDKTDLVHVDRCVPICSSSNVHRSDLVLVKIR